jgi:hypothetical protein
MVMHVQVITGDCSRSGLPCLREKGKRQTTIGRAVIIARPDGSKPRYIARCGRGDDGQVVIPVRPGYWVLEARTWIDWEADARVYAGTVDRVLDAQSGNTTILLVRIAEYTVMLGCDGETTAALAATAVTASQVPSLLRDALCALLDKVSSRQAGVFYALPRQRR